MRLVLEHIETRGNESFCVHRDSQHAFDCPFHFHPEIELTLIENSHGTRVVGESIERFEAGDLVLMGPNLPHWYYNDPESAGAANWARSVVVQFQENFLGNDFWSAREFVGVRNLLQSAMSGLKIAPEALDVREQVSRLPQLQGVARLSGLLEVLDTLARMDHQLLIPLSTAHIQSELAQSDALRVKRTFDYIRQRATFDDVSLADVAARANMTQTSFSRFFKQKVGKTFQSVLTETRLTEACRLLRVSRQPITDICYACGFGNLSNFNRQFKSLYGMSPRQYRTRHSTPDGVEPSRPAPLPRLPALNSVIPGRARPASPDKKASARPQAPS